MAMLNMLIPEFWSTYYQATTSLLAGNAEEWIRHSDLAFPKMAKCDFRPYGPSGSQQNFDAFCLLPQNVLSQKLFVIIWLWYIMQVTVSICNIAYWAVLIYSVNIRIWVLQGVAMKGISRKLIQHSLRNVQLGHFFILKQIAKNTNVTTFVELLSELTLGSTNLNSSKSI